MIGELINKFDNLPENECTLKTFNKMFKTEVEGKESSQIEIKGIVAGSLREVLIDNNLTRVLMPDIKSLDHIIDDNFTVYQVDIDGEVKGIYSSFRAIAEAMNVSYNTVRAYTDKDHNYYGYNITTLKTSEGVYNNAIKEGTVKLPIDKSRRRDPQQGRPSLYEYTVELESGEKHVFSSPAKCGKLVGATRKAISYRIKKAAGKMLKGYAVTRKYIGE